ncbi:exodeoxyribonuclease VII large subunit [Thermobrachium celere]|uniref:exodeoxyribonuclease VII large subunit n=1 Tax=Thermobrachium celere TaxID=53422 RepID=UPI001944811E|nr:exodeoxyribonuclease VII large subunit [Thermobrachium celere]GFR34269.1 exodeoxyribonuclease 7 large subunit [Thermobrachium celere]
MSKNALTVSELNLYIKELIEGTSELNNIVVKGEISNFKHHSSGHMYFTLKDNESKIKCVMFKGYNSYLKIKLEDGMKVLAKGYVSVYERDGVYQLYCTDIKKDGLGDLYLAYEELKKKLEAEGLFDERHKKKLPMLPRRIGVATSSTGAVIRDIINVSTRRFYNVDILLYPVKVQGEGAAQTIVEAIEYFNTRNDIDVIIIGRGGGSIEELWAFNEEIVARAIHNSKIPVVSAVGHETDFTIADFVADVRASTPSHAAEIVVPSYSELVYKINTLKNTLFSNVNNRLKRDKIYVENLRSKVKLYSPQNRINVNYQYLDNLREKLINSVSNKFINKRHNLMLTIQKLDGLSPLKSISRGFAAVVKEEKLIKSIQQLNKDDIIEVYFSDGKAICTINEKSEVKLWQE